MKKTEAMSILAASVRPREPKDRARYDKAVKMAIEALRCSEIPNGSDDTISRRAAIEKMEMLYRDARDDTNYMLIGYNHALSDMQAILKSLPSAQPEQQHGRIFQEIVVRYPLYNPYPEYQGKPYFSIKYTENGQEFIGYGTYKPEVLSEYLKEYFMPSAQPDNQINLCDSCDYSYPECPAKYDDVIFGNGIGNDNICACNKYKPSAQSEQRWIPCSERLPDDLTEVNVTYVNHDPEPYYASTKDKPFTGSAIYYEGNWYWYSSTCADYLGEYGRNDMDKVDDMIEITAWMPLPEPYRGNM